MRKLPGAKKLETEGKTDTAAGKVQSAASGLKDVARQTTQRHRWRLPWN
jgi:uncharacterized protein YjbJ (UPF0337 family)